jgi:flagellar hook-basal body complex protein FliE
MANVTNAAMAAYNAALKQMNAPGVEPREVAGPSFSELLAQAADQAMQTARAGEAQSLAATAGTADVAEVVTAVAAAELTVQTVTALRDRVVAAYQDILRMPI